MKKSKIVIYMVLTAAALVMLFPYLWMILSSLKTSGEIHMIPPTFFPERPTLSNYATLFGKLPYARLFLNTVLSTVSRIAAQLILCSMAAYAFAKIRFPGRSALFLIILSVMMVPSQIHMVPQYNIMSALGMVNTVGALILNGLASAFGIFLLRQFFATLPDELVESAKVDGCSHLRIYFSITLPLIGPALVTLAIFVIQWTWNDLMWPLIVNTSLTTLPLAAGLAQLAFGEYATDHHIVMAGAAAATLPILAVFIALQKYYVEGIKLSGLK